VDISEITRRLFDHHRPPAREQFVLEQGFMRDVAMCRKLLPDPRMWPLELDSAAGAGPRVRIDRRMIFAIAQRAGAAIDADPCAATQLHAAIVFWGAPPGQSAKRAARVFADPNAPKRFSAAFKMARSEGPESTYNALSRSRRLGPRPFLLHRWLMYR
jgi:hypothetical protein